MVDDAGLYARISDDREGLEQGVERQVEDGHRLADRLDLRVIDTYVDNDRGASTRSRKPRPEYARMLDDARTGRISTIIAYSNSRLTRRPREVEDLIELHERYGVRIHTVVSGDDDLSTADGRMVARIKGNVDAAEAERTGERVARAFQQRAERGLPHGAVAYGWTRTPGQPDAADPAVAPIIAEAARRIARGESARSICTDLNERGVRPPRGDRWSATLLRQILLRERNCGRLVRKGQVIGTGTWEPIVDEDTHDRVVAILRDPNRKTARGNELRYYLAGVLTCGKCGAPLRTAVGRVVTVNGREKRQPPAYWCGECYGIRRKISDVEDTVEALVVGRLNMPDGPELLSGSPEVVREQTARAEALRARLDRAADDYADGLITQEQLRRITGKLRPQIEDATRRAREAGPSPQLEEFSKGGDVRPAWDAASPDRKRQVVNTLFKRIVVKPAGQGRAFDPDLIAVEWRRA